MNIQTIKIPDEAMAALVHQHFEADRINHERDVMRIKAEWDERHKPIKTNIPQYEVEIAGILPEKIADFDALVSPLEYNYITLESDNSLGGLQVYVRAMSDDGSVAYDDLSLRTQYYIQHNGKYVFTNQPR